MKVFGFNGYFLLPDDFEGNYNDALEELLKYRRMDNIVVKEGLDDRTTQEDIWNKFLEIILQDKKTLGGYSLTKHNKETNTMEDF